MCLKRCSKWMFFKIGPLFKKYGYLSFKKLRWKNFAEYSTKEFKDGLIKIGISKGDALYIMCSVKRVYEKTGCFLPVKTLLNDIFDVIGEEGTILVLAFSDNREEIIKGKTRFNVKETTVNRNGSLSRHVFKKENATRSLQPVFSVLAMGKHADDLCADHHRSPFPFDEKSPFRKLADKGGKYLGIGQGIEAFTPAHMIEDFFKYDFGEWVYNDEPLEFQCIDGKGKERGVKSYIRGDFDKMLDLITHFKQLAIEYKTCITPQSGIFLFTMNMAEYLDASIQLYRNKALTIWSSRLPGVFNPLVQMSRKLRYHFRQL